MPSNSAPARIGKRALTVTVGLAGVALTVGIVGGGVTLPWPTITASPASPASQVVAPMPSEQQRVCPGPVLNLAEDSSQAQAATSVGQAEAVHIARSTAASDTALPITERDLTGVDDSSGAAAPLVLSLLAEPGATEAPLIAGSQSQTLATETLAGFTAAACAEATSDAWLVGGSTDVGRTSLVLLSNPTTVLATVDISVFGEAGIVDAPGATGILVQPGEQRIVSLAGLAPNLMSPVVHVQSSGGQTSATLEQSSIRGIEPDGLELIASSARPDFRQVIAGVRLLSSPAADANGTDAGLPEGTPSVRVLVTGTEPATVQVGVVSTTAGTAGTSREVELEPGIATDIPLPDLTEGTFSIEVTSDQPVVAAARTETTGTANKDFSWFTASEALTDDFLVSVAPGPGPVLHLVNTATTDARISLAPEGGTRVTIAVPAGAPVDVPLIAGTNYAVTGAEAIVAAVGYSGDGALSSFAVRPAGPLAAPITVYVH
ncbi:DUF5719 family protein [Cryobacterium psychrophilum]|uniref:Uncharacterized protein n=1 Tax=Cryobacterium psychrophilum TaxID=41988 RepID=A0A4Y8KLP1_9MICO|nr:DUF5719 family protein [Cryobacterium psychrophilum]TDW30713.1 hypothetical protein EDD25_2483 [Cryobacterium psychrophilum]TFD76605.1 hypothetical protein E3T53_13170 [Cryobacterium psychrophilum]